MENYVKRLGAFLRNLRVCMADANRDTDTYYHIPKTRFRDNGGDPVSAEPSPPRPKTHPKNYFLGSFRDCLLDAWRTSDRDYYIPKTRFLDAEYNGTAYRDPPGPGVLARVGQVLGTFKECIQVSWEASDIFYHVPKSRYQEAGFIRELMDLSPEPRGKLRYRPYTIGRGTVLPETVGRGWFVAAPDQGHEGEEEEVCFIPDQPPVPKGKRDLEM